MESLLMVRDAFRAAVLKRDGYKCICCSKPATDAHHIMDRKLFEDGGYYLNNGASVCADCHWLCEKNIILPLSLRKLLELKIEDYVAPPGIQKGVLNMYDKWGKMLYESLFQVVV